MKIDPRNIYELKGVVQPYGWGGGEYIPALLGIENNEGTRFAEYWMGAHPSAPSLIRNNGEELALDKVINLQPALIGMKVFEKYHQLPYLFKILDVKEMLSIQVHPSREGANKGYEAEEETGLPIHAPNRNYKDRNHKPEVMVALSDFWLLHGFKDAEIIMNTLNAIPAFRDFIPVFESGGHRGLFEHLVNLPQHEVDTILLPLVQKEVRRRAYHESEKDEPGYWVGEYYLNKEQTNIDRGVFCIYLFNLLNLHKGQGIFQGAGVPHAYLQGQNVELMANSDNVLRAGLTNKHVDVKELMKHTLFEPVHPVVLEGAPASYETIYDCPVDDFNISRIELPASQTYSGTAWSAEIFICLEGNAIVKGGNSLTVKKGDAFIAFSGNKYQVEAETASVFYKASVPTQ